MVVMSSHPTNYSRKANTTTRLQGSSSIVSIVLVAIAYKLLVSYPQPELDWEGVILPSARNFRKNIIYHHHRRHDDDNSDGDTGDSGLAPPAESIVTTTTTPMRFPLKGFVVAITGATSGIGLALTRRLCQLGAQVVVIGRSPSKLASIQEELPLLFHDDEDGKHNDSSGGGGGVLLTVVADMSDLDSVARASEEIVAASSTIIPRLDALINNAGIFSGYNDFIFNSTKQGYGLVFGVNYLSHFLLTEKLLPLLLVNNDNKTSTSRQAQIIQISSSAHMAVDGSDFESLLLDADSSSSNPNNTGVPTTSSSLDDETLEDTSLFLASRPAGSNHHHHGFHVWRGFRQYGNSKLAQLLHARALQRRYDPLTLRVVSVCPSHVSTEIRFPSSSSSKNHHYRHDSIASSIRTTLFWEISKNMYRVYGFPSNGHGMASTLMALFSAASVSTDEKTTSCTTGGTSCLLLQEKEETKKKKEEEDDYFINTSLLLPFIWFAHSLVPAKYPTWLPLTEVLFDVGSTLIVHLQRYFPYHGPARSSPASYNIKLQEKLYEWSREAVAPWLE